MGKTLEEIEQMPESHFREYQLFYQEQPFGIWREDYRTAQISHLLAMINRDPKGKEPDCQILCRFLEIKRIKMTMTTVRRLI